MTESDGASDATVDPPTADGSAVGGPADEASARAGSTSDGSTDGKSAAGRSGGPVGDDGGWLLFDADGTPRWVTPVTHFGAAAGFSLVLFGFAVLFVLPGHPLAVTFGDGAVVRARDGVGTGAVSLLAGASLAAGFAAGIGFPLLTGDRPDGVRLELAVGVFGPTAVAAGAAGISAVAVPTLAILAAGDPAGSLLYALNTSQSAGLLLLVFCGGYVVVPSTVGVFVGSLLGRAVTAIGGRDSG